MVSFCLSNLKIKLKIARQIEGKSIKVVVVVVVVVVGVVKEWCLYHREKVNFVLINISIITTYVLLNFESPDDDSPL